MVAKLRKWARKVKEVFVVLWSHRKRTLGNM